ncbi:nuclease SbcCD subunit D [Gordonia polyisoprenivorans NBRC 16320 = JCM 10675]|uniref:Nuclease SbcCD subunit D n=1 Tax=Gordonia polyisoprenivorans TaxID=84595 RepID=A0A846WUP7_9ACTN|nr:exonuclease SbcCD subunit D [Gordonia polyisoprenivorans]NKY04656.1 exonuclease SbcCD subunit D [Gordonia polyisoprenivorans]UZF58256.1 exonuclease SbcCD subunit D [Gordonia polyisoprenivorans]GAB21942.1 nuclease SbcCD subunit D [Gordonia polyisoprenivorans NBRC 16320 = JCM 10675]
MRILHTSDWHLGRTFHGVELLSDQRRMLADIAAIVAAESVDVVVVAGDVYDRSVPSADAVSVYDAGLGDIAAAGAQIVVTSGNHDSPTRLGAASAFAAAGGLHLRTSVAAIDTPVLLDDEFGPVAFYGIPYLEPDAVRKAFDIDAPCGHQGVLGAAMDRVRADATARGARTVVAAHAFVSGAVSTGSERSISVGGVETVAADTFSGIDYVALGHLHSPQEITPAVRYSGSPMPYSFGENSHRKGVWLVDLDADGVTDVRLHELPALRGLSSLRGTLDELLGDEKYADAHEHYIEATLTDTIRPLDAMRRLRERFPYAVHVHWERPEALGRLDYRSRIRGRTDAEIIAAFVGDVRDEPSAAERDLIERALREVVGEPEVVEAGAAEVGAADIEAIEADQGQWALFALDTEPKSA